MSLSDWQTRLASHFAGLRSLRNEGNPIFALEHDLNSSELVSLSEEVRKHILLQPPIDDHYLPWIIYATELGYKYSGDEYWQTFEANTSGWKSCGDRNFIRRSFKKFYKSYRSAKPTGVWSEHFTIICWPITNSILPKDLQFQLARLLYSSRHHLNPSLFKSPSILGGFIEDICSKTNVSSRFRHFAQEHRLVGQLVMALLLQDEFFKDALILPGTLKRIIKDLDETQKSREWLKEAKKVAIEKFKGLRQGDIDRILSGKDDVEISLESSQFYLEPQIILKSSEENSWKVVLELPDFSPLLILSPSLRVIFNESRAYIKCSKRGFVARGRLLHGKQSVVLKEWPEANEPILEFDEKDPSLEHILQKYFTSKESRVWLYKINDEGCGYEVVSKVVRPNQKYIVIGRSELAPISNIARHVDIRCADIYGQILETPKSFTSELLEQLQQISLVAAKTIYVWPVGLPPISWSGEGKIELLTKDKLRLGIKSDHSIESLSLTLSNHQSPLKISPTKPGEPIFVEFQRLDAGIHTLSIAHKTSSGVINEKQAYLDIYVREPSISNPLSSNSTPLVIIFDPPYDPTLEQLFSQEVNTKILAPMHRKIKITVSLFENISNNPLVKKSFNLPKPPITPEKWKAEFEKHIIKDKSIAKQIGRSSMCRLKIDAGEYGYYEFDCERDHSPLRWVVISDGAKLFLHLVDDTDSDSPSLVKFYQADRPDKGDKIEYDSVVKGKEISVSGGLFYAENEIESAGLLLPPVIRELDDLKIEPTLSNYSRSISDIKRLLELCELWANANAQGSFSAIIMRRAIIKKLCENICKIIYGENWDRAEKAFRECNLGERNKHIRSLKQCITNNADEHVIGNVIERGCEGLLNRPSNFKIKNLVGLLSAPPGLLPPPTVRKIRKKSPTNPKINIVQKREIFDETHPDWIVEFALRLSSQPHRVRGWADCKLESGLDVIFNKPIIGKASRFLVLCTDCISADPIEIGVLYNGWNWE